MRFILGLVLAASFIAPALAQRQPARPKALPQPAEWAAEYDACIRRAAGEPQAAYEMARAWRARVSARSANASAWLG